MLQIDLNLGLLSKKNVGFAPAARILNIALFATNGRRRKRSEIAKRFKGRKSMKQWNIHELFSFLSLNSFRRYHNSKRNGNKFSYACGWLRLLSEIFAFSRSQVSSIAQGKALDWRLLMMDFPAERKSLKVKLNDGICVLDYSSKTETLSRHKKVTFNLKEFPSRRVANL